MEECKNEEIKKEVVNENCKEDTQLNAVKTELMEYDKWVRYNCSDLYAETSRTMKILRSSKFIPYSLIAKTVRLYEKRKA